MTFQPKLSSLSAIIPSPNLLASRAMLVNLSIRMWSARRIDRRVTEEVNAAHGASADAGRYNKSLVAKEALGAIVGAANAARSVHYGRTLPWLDDGARILPSAGYQEYADRLRRIRSDYESAVADFVSAYPSYVDDARSRLNGLFDPADYPDPRDIAARFAFSVRVLPMPDAGDFRAALSDSQAAAIRAEIEESSRAALDAAMRDAWTRVSECVGRMVERLKAYKPGADGTRATGIFRDSLVENVRELVDILPSLNLTSDPALDSIVRRMESELCRHDADELRESDVLRRDTAASAESILADVAAYMA